jgi:hypothetical protein
VKESERRDVGDAWQEVRSVVDPQRTTSDSLIYVLEAAAVLGAASLQARLN